MRLLMFMAALLLPAAAAAAPAQYEATPQTIAAVAKKVQCGDIVQLVGAFERFNTLRVQCPNDNRVEVNATRATFRSIMLLNTQGLTFTGGKVDGKGDETSAVTINTSRFIRVAGQLITGAKNGIGITKSQDVEIVGNRFDGCRSDGLDIAQSQRVLVLANQAVNFQPKRKTYSADGKLLKDADHSDGFQFWSVKGSPPTADLTFIGNYAEGEIQGISGFNPGSGGYDRITMRWNWVDVQYWHGIAVYEGRDTVIRDNFVRTVPGTLEQPFPHQVVKTWIKTTGGNPESVCGNRVVAYPGSAAEKPCPSQDPKLVNVMPATRK